jgi:hypothetical protein
MCRHHNERFVFSASLTQSAGSSPGNSEISMQLSPTRFMKIEGTEVVVYVNSSEQAKIAMKELSHKKKELAHIKRALLRQQRSMRRRSARAERPRSALWNIFDPDKKLVRAVSAVIGVFVPPKPAREPADVARDLTQIDEIVHNIDSCRLQIQGKLINHG